MKPAPFKSRQLPGQRSSEERRPSEEPRTGVVRKVSAQSLEPRIVPPSSNRRSDLRLAQRASRGWRCLEPVQPEEQRPRRDSSVSIAHVSLAGECLHQSGPDEWLPEAVEFVHRAALLVAQGLGFERCRSVCLQGPKSVLSVSDAGPSTVTGVTGPVRQLSNVLRIRGLK